jgi:hypothetical protein
MVNINYLRKVLVGRARHLERHPHVEWRQTLCSIGPQRLGSMSQLENVAFDEMALARRKAWLALDLLRAGGSQRFERL